MTASQKANAKKRPEIVLATAISGCGEKNYLKRWEEYCRKRGKKVKIYDVGGMILAEAENIGVKLNLDNILNADDHFLSALRLAAFKQIKSEIENDASHDAIIICVHAFFYWKKGFYLSNDMTDAMFSPDMYITFIEDYQRILANLNSKKQWQSQRLRGEEILHWQDVEAEVTRGWARRDGRKPFFCVPSSVSQSPSLLYKLVFRPEIEPLYTAMPISHFQKPEDRKKLDRILGELDKRFAVFSPLSIEVVGSVRVRKNKELTRSSQAVHSHIVSRDEKWLLSQCRIMVVIWPTREPPEIVKKNKELLKLWPRSVASPGADHETHTGYRQTLDVWTIFLGNETSPFLAHYNTRLFKSEKEFIKFLNTQYPERRNFSW